MFQMFIFIYMSFYIHYMYMHYVYIYIYIKRERERDRERCFSEEYLFFVHAWMSMSERSTKRESTGGCAQFGKQESGNTVCFHDFKSRNFKLSVSNPKSKYVAYLPVLSQISNCQGLGRKNKHEILKTDRMGVPPEQILVSKGRTSHGHGESQKFLDPAIHSVRISLVADFSRGFCSALRRLERVRARSCNPAKRDEGGTVCRHWAPCELLIE